MLTKNTRLANRLDGQLHRVVVNSIGAWTQHGCIPCVDCCHCNLLYSLFAPDVLYTVMSSTVFITVGFFIVISSTKYRVLVSR